MVIFPTGGSNLRTKDEELQMYHLMKSEKFSLVHATSGPMIAYRQTEIGHFERFPDAYAACEVNNNEGTSRCYVVNESCQEYNDGTWIE